MNKKEKFLQLINNNNNLLYEVDHLYQTPLHWAAKRGYNDLTEKILAKGKSTNIRDINGRTPLFLAALNGNISIVEVKQNFNLLDDTEKQNPADYEPIFLKQRKKNSPRGN